MSINDFYVALQELLLKAKEQGWSRSQIEDYYTNAFYEFDEEEFPDETD